MNANLGSQRQTNGKTNRRTEKETDRQIDKETDKQTQTDKQTNRQTDKEDQKTDKQADKRIDKNIVLSQPAGSGHEARVSTWCTRIHSHTQTSTQLPQTLTRKESALAPFSGNIYRQTLDVKTHTTFHS